MPVKPNVASLNASSVEILNAIRANASYEYQNRIPVATQNNLKDVGEAMMQYVPGQNEFLTALVNRIGRVIITSKSYTNPLAPFKKGMLEFGESVEEIFVRIASAHEFNQQLAETQIFKREIPNVDAVFHKLNSKHFYKATISNDQLRQAFLSYNGITDLISRIVDSMYTGAQYDEFLMMKQMISEAAIDGAMYAINVPAITADNAKSIVTTIKGISNAMEFPTTIYNSMGVLTQTPKEDQIVLLDAKFDAAIDVEVLASAFNMDKAQFMGQRVLVDNFGTITGVVAAIVDRDWFMVFDNYMNFAEQYNGEGLYWNYWYHIWQTFSRSPYANAILFTTQNPAVTALTVTPSTATASRSQGVQLTAAVTTTGYAPKGVVWTINSSNSTVDDKGFVTIGVNETAATLVVTATSAFDSSKKDTATITVTA